MCSNDEIGVIDCGDLDERIDHSPPVCLVKLNHNKQGDKTLDSRDTPIKPNSPPSTDCMTSALLPSTPEAPRSAQSPSSSPAALPDDALSHTDVVIDHVSESTEQSEVPAALDEVSASPVACPTDADTTTTLTVENTEQKCSEGPQTEVVPTQLVEPLIVEPVAVITATVDAPDPIVPTKVAPLTLPPASPLPPPPSSPPPPPSPLPPPVSSVDTVVLDGGITCDDDDDDDDDEDDHPLTVDLNDECDGVVANETAQMKTDEGPSPPVATTVCSTAPTRECKQTEIPQLDSTGKQSPILVLDDPIVSTQESVSSTVEPVEVQSVRVDVLPRAELVPFASQATTTTPPPPTETVIIPQVQVTIPAPTIPSPLVISRSIIDPPPHPRSIPIPLNTRALTTITTNTRTTPTPIAFSRPSPIMPNPITPLAPPTVYIPSTVPDIRPRPVPLAPPSIPSASLSQQSLTNNTNHHFTTTSSYPSMISCVSCGDYTSVATPPPLSSPCPMHLTPFATGPPCSMASLAFSGLSGLNGGAMPLGPGGPGGAGNALQILSMTPIPQLMGTPGIVLHNTGAGGGGTSNFPQPTAPFLSNLSAVGGVGGGLGPGGSLNFMHQTHQSPFGHPTLLQPSGPTDLLLDPATLGLSHPFGQVTSLAMLNHNNSSMLDSFATNHFSSPSAVFHHQQHQHHPSLMHSHVDLTSQASNATNPTPMFIPPSGIHRNSLSGITSLVSATTPQMSTSLYGHGGGGGPPHHPAGLYPTPGSLVSGPGHNGGLFLQPTPTASLLPPTQFCPTSAPLLQSCPFPSYSLSMPMNPVDSGITVSIAPSGLSVLSSRAEDYQHLHPTICSTSYPISPSRPATLQPAPQLTTTTTSSYTMGGASPSVGLGLPMPPVLQPCPSVLSPRPLLPLTGVSRGGTINNAYSFPSRQTAAAPIVTTRPRIFPSTMSGMLPKSPASHPIAARSLGGSIGILAPNSTTVLPALRRRRPIGARRPKRGLSNGTTALGDSNTFSQLAGNSGCFVLPCGDNATDESHGSLPDCDSAAMDTSPIGTLGSIPPSVTCTSPERVSSPKVTSSVQSVSSTPPKDTSTKPLNVSVPDTLPVSMSICHPKFPNPVASSFSCGTQLSTVVESTPSSNGLSHRNKDPATKSPAAAAAAQNEASRKSAPPDPSTPSSTLSSSTSSASSSSASSSSRSAASPPSPSVQSTTGYRTTDSSAKLTNGPSRCGTVELHASMQRLDVSCDKSQTPLPGRQSLTDRVNDAHMIKLTTSPLEATGLLPVVRKHSHPMEMPKRSPVLRRTAGKHRILTHFIDGHVIYESNKPFPVKNGMSVVEAALLQQCMKEEEVDEAEQQQPHKFNALSTPTPFKQVTRDGAIMNGFEPMQLDEQEEEEETDEKSRTKPLAHNDHPFVETNTTTHNLLKNDRLQHEPGTAKSRVTPAVMSNGRQFSGKSVSKTADAPLSGKETSEIRKATEKAHSKQATVNNISSPTPFAHEVSPPGSVRLDGLHSTSVQSHPSPVRHLSTVSVGHDVVATNTIVTTTGPSPNTGARTGTTPAVTLTNRFQFHPHPEPQLPTPPPPGPVKRWSADDVVAFVRGTPGCGAYATAFLNNEIDGEALLLLGNDQFIQAPISMKIGPALKLVARLDAVRNL